MQRAVLLSILIFISIIRDAAGQVRAVTDKVDAYVYSKMDSLHIPGVSLAIVNNGKVVYTKGYGYANLEFRVPATAGSNYLIASVTKSFTAVAVMMLWEQGKLKLDDAIGNYLSGIPEHWRPLTIQQLLNHTSGIPSNLEMPAPCEFEFDPDHYTLAEYFKEVACLPLNFSPGSKWEYSGTTGYNLLGLLVEKIAGVPYASFLRQNIFVPLSMHETGRMNYDTLIPNRANGYHYEDNSFKNSVRMDYVGEFAAGGLMSTVTDLAKFDAALNTDKLLKRKTLDLMFTNARLNDGTIVPSYGLGFGLTPYKGHKRVGHTGGAPGFSSSFNRFVDKKITVIVLTNAHHDEFNVLKFSNEIAMLFFKIEMYGQTHLQNKKW